MNKRIKELAIEAGLIAVKANGFDRTTLTDAEARFAELLIKEYVSSIYALDDEVPVHEEENENVWNA